MAEQTFLGPFATQAGKPTTRQTIAPAYSPTLTGGAAPTIGLPGQDPIDSTKRPFPIGDPKPFDPEKERLKKELEKAKQIQTNIDPTVVSGPIDRNFALDGIRGQNPGKTDIEIEDIYNNSSASTLQTYEMMGRPATPFSENIEDLLGAVGKAGKGIVQAGIQLGLKTTTVGRAISAVDTLQQKFTGQESFLKSFDKEKQEEPIGTLDTIKDPYTVPTSTFTDRSYQIGTGSIFSNYSDQFLGVNPFERERAIMSQTATEPLPPIAPSPSFTAGSVGQSFFGNDPTYAGGNKEGSDGLYATGGSGAFTSFDHYTAGVSQLDESNIAADLLNDPNSAINTPEDAREFITELIDEGLNESDIRGAVNSQKQGTGAIEIAQQFTPDVDASPKVICAELYRQGLLEKEIFELDEEFGRHLRKVNPDIINGYHQWALPLVSLMQRSIVASHIIKFIARPVIKHIAYQMGYPSKTYL